MDNLIKYLNEHWGLTTKYNSVERGNSDWKPPLSMVQQPGYTFPEAITLFEFSLVIIAADTVVSFPSLTRTHALGQKIKNIYISQEPTKQITYCTFFNKYLKMYNNILYRWKLFGRKLHYTPSYYRQPWNCFLRKIVLFQFWHLQYLPIHAILGQILDLSTFLLYIEHVEVPPDTNYIMKE